MKQKLILLYFIFLHLTIQSCSSEKSIEKLLLSNDKDDNIEGAMKAENAENKKFINLLLQNSEDWRTSTNLQFKGVSVYQAKMQALQKIFKVKPPVEITFRPDSTIIYFYNDLYKKSIKK